MKIHPAANEFPMMSDDRFAELLEDIRANGQRSPITLIDGKILDGRNRYKACCELGIKPATRNHDGDPWSYVWSLNGQRRDLVAEQRYLIWKHCHAQSAKWTSEQQQIRDKANQKRSKAAKSQPRKNGRISGPPMICPQCGGSIHLGKEKEHKCKKQVPQQSVEVPASDKGNQAKAAASHTNRGAVARGDKLAKDRPDLAKKVRQGEMKPADAYRQMKRDEVVKNLESVEAKKAKAVKGVYDVIVIDPPWPMQKIDRDERPNQVAFDYPVMQEEELRSLPIPLASDCHVWVWTTHKFLPMALRLLEAWGLKYVCTFVWHKPGGFQPIGLPQFNCEFVLYARKGSPKFVSTKSFNTCFEAPRGKHSEKPEEFYEILRRVTAGRRLDMFNRRPLKGFDSWGKEAANGMD